MHIILRAISKTQTLRERHPIDNKTFHIQLSAIAGSTLVPEKIEK